jgi:NAD(P)-dependent dehydrogenase (short-subunit alcohol dehydrogenase family)
MSPTGTGKIAAVTGAASGIGHAACRRLLQSGWTVFGLDVAERRLEAVSDGFAGFQSRFNPLVCDVADAASVAAAFDQVGETLDALVCCAGVLRTALLENMAVEDFDLVLNTVSVRPEGTSPAAAGRDRRKSFARGPAVIYCRAAAKDRQRCLRGLQGRR